MFGANFVILGSFRVRLSSVQLSSAKMFRTKKINFEMVTPTCVLLAWNCPHYHHQHQHHHHHHRADYSPRSVLRASQPMDQFDQALVRPPRTHARFTLVILTIICYIYNIFTHASYTLCYILFFVPSRLCDPCNCRHTDILR